MKTAFQPLGVWRAFGCTSMGLVVDEGRQVLPGGHRAPEAIAPDSFDVSDGGFNIQD